MFYATPCKYSIRLRREFRAKPLTNWAIPEIRSNVKRTILEAGRHQGDWGWMKEFTK